MKPPPGYTNDDRVCRLIKAIYGLKQSPRASYQKLHDALLTTGFFHSHSDHSLFIRSTNTGIVLLVYNIILTGSDTSGIEDIKLYLKTVFDIKDLGPLQYFLGIEVTRDTNDIFLSQRKYILDLLTETGKLGTKLVRTPLEEHFKDQREGECLEHAEQYRRVVGKLIYLTITRPHLSFIVHQVSQWIHAPTTSHWQIVDRILKYLKGTPNKGLWMRNNNHTEIIGYCDADWAGDMMDLKSTTGYCTFIGGNLVTWKSKKQTMVARSSAEAEYRARANTTSEIIWLKQLLKDFGIDSTQPVPLHCDNQAALHVAANSIFHERMKHIEVDCHFIYRENHKRDNISDVHTKSRPTCRHLHQGDKLVCS
ncbi:PREDICTED: uncharacterized protein LOC104807063 isoform X1 [Tarenaya hassleriana]|uniref:uncharacterized protein LOC104807063 isoform X1 n=1 Tax=Tarenaya hassleriana TaxID=28532 RepID=UPI0008FD0FDD|nr:PREDICTED: uncharacterized protein LOC104807063 isoform X1 [Tarenaya hassleriana]XP_019057332.1 PREDICTED: uncharacterized protein LOC104807063 isoform X1 [Tarenaya hassleriana]